MRPYPLLPTIALVASCAAPTSPASVTLAKYDQLTTGMTYEAATAILGPGTEVSRSGSGDSEAIMYSWKNPDGSNMVATFQGGKLVSKAQFGLK